MAQCPFCKAEVAQPDWLKHQWTQHHAEQLALVRKARSQKQPPENKKNEPPPAENEPPPAENEPPPIKHEPPAEPKKNEPPAALPDMEADFLQLLRDLNIKNPESVAKYLCETGDLNDVTHVASALGETDITDTKRRQVIKVWAKKRGRILTDEELKQISGQHDHTHSQGQQPSPFIADAEGNWSINPKASVTIESMLALEAYKALKERGQQADPFELMASQAAKWNAFKTELGLLPASDKQETPTGILKDVTGALKDMKEIVSPAPQPAPSGTSIKDITGALKDMKEIVSPPAAPASSGSGIKETVDAIKTMLEVVAPGKEELKALKEKLEEVGKRPATDPQVEALVKQVDTLREQLATKDRENFEKRIEGLTEQVAMLRQTTQGKGELDIMSQALTAIDRRAAAWENVIRSIYMRPPTPMSPEERQALTMGIAEEAAKDARLTELGDRLFFSKP